MCEAYVNVPEVIVIIVASRRVIIPFCVVKLESFGSIGIWRGFIRPARIIVDNLHSIY